MTEFIAPGTVALIVSPAPPFPVVSAAFCIASSASAQAVFVTASRAFEVHGVRPAIMFARYESGSKAPPTVITGSSPRTGVVLTLLRVNSREKGDVEPRPLDLTFRALDPDQDLSVLDMTDERETVTTHATWDSTKVGGGDMMSLRTETFVHEGAPLIDHSNAVVAVATSTKNKGSYYEVEAIAASSLNSLSLGLETDYGGVRTYTVEQMARGAMVQIR